MDSLLEKLNMRCKLVLNIPQGVIKLNLQKGEPPKKHIKTDLCKQGLSFLESNELIDFSDKN